MKIITVRDGNENENIPWAMNPYRGCTHGCRYCYMTSMPWIKKEQYWSDPNPKKDVITRLEYDVNKADKNSPEIMLCSCGDGYQPAEMKTELTRNSIQTIRDYDLYFTTLTKGGTRAVRDFDLYENYPKCRFGSTITFLDQKDADYWEPNTAAILDRIKAIEIAHNKGIKTWVCLEPVIDPIQALAIIEALHPIVGYWKVGKINYCPDAEKNVDWIRFRTDVEELLNSLEADYYLKESLTKL